MANKYFIANGGNFTDTTKWAASAADAASNTNSSSTPTNADTAFLIAASGQCTISATSVCGVLDASLYANTLTHNAFTLTVSGNITLPTVGIGTYTPADSSSAILISNATGTLITGGNLIRAFRVTSGTLTLGDNLAFYASENCILDNRSTINMGGFTITGNSSTNRLFIQSQTLGTGKTITNALATSFNNVDFRDITFTTAGDLDLTNSGANLIGDCGGNSATGGALTMTTTSTQTWDGSTNNSDVAASWTSRVPLPQDTIVFGNGTGTCTWNSPRMGSDISFTSAVKLTLGNAVTSYGSVDFTNGGTLAGAFNWTFESNARSGNYYFTSAGKTIVQNIIVSSVGATLIFNDALTISSDLLSSYGDIDNRTNNVNVTAANFKGGSTVIARTIYLGNSTWKVTTISAGGGWDFSSGSPSPTIVAGNSTIWISNTGANKKRFAGQGKTFCNLLLPSGSGGCDITGNNTFTGTVTCPSNSLVVLASSSTQNVANFIATGSAGNVITLQSSSAGTPWNITKTGGGTIQTDWCAITDSNASPASTWYYGNNGTADAYSQAHGWNSGIAPASLKRNSNYAGVHLSAYGLATI